MNDTNAPELVTIFDTTLRDGEQSPGASLNNLEKLEIARALEQLGVDVIEAGFPITSKNDFQAVRMIAGELSRPVIAALARSLEQDIKRAGEALEGAAHPRIHVFCATSAIHRQYKLNKACEEIIKISTEAVQLAKTFTDDVEFSPEDASRTEPQFLKEVIEAVIAAGATTVNIPDTVGYAMPEQFAELIRYLRRSVPNIGDAVISVHCHDDLGLAVANSLAAIKAGARQVECTINGLGERAGNASLEEVVMAVKTRRDFFGRLRTNIRTERLYPTSRLVSSLTGIHVQRNKAVVGENAFAHEAGVHQDGILKHHATYEIMRPQDVGMPESRLVLGKHSGRHALRDRIAELGYTLTDAQVDEVFDRFKDLADKKKEIFDEDIEALVEDVIKQTPRIWQLQKLQTSAGTGMIPTATVALRHADGQLVQDAATGNGPIDAVYECIQRITQLRVKLLDYQLRAITSGKEAVGEVMVTIQYAPQARPVKGRAHSTDIIEASAQAYLNAVNRALAQPNNNGRNGGATRPAEQP